MVSGSAPVPSANKVGLAASGESLPAIAGYKLLAKIGQGAMGTVFKARQLSLDREVALKLLPPRIAQDATFIERFQREARASAKLNHPHIIQGIDVGQDPVSKLWYFAMEYVDGKSLIQILKEKGAFPEREALEICRDVAQALAAAHRAGMIHRDVKPDNILLTAQGTAKLADLGLARGIQDDASLTQTGMTVGTPHYMAPEQVRGQTALFDGRTDLYALGATLHHLVTGQPPFEGESGAVIMAQHLSRMPSRASRLNPRVSEDCSRLILQMMQKEMARRPASAEAVAKNIERILAGPSRFAISGPQPPVGTSGFKPRLHETRREESARTAPSQPVWWLGGGIAALALAALLLFGLPRGRTRASAPAAAPSKTETPVEARKPAPPDSPAKPVSAGDLAQLWEYVKKWEAEHPQAYQELTSRYQTVAETARGTLFEMEYKDKVAQALSGLRAREAAALDAVWQPLATVARKRAQEGDYDGALAVIAAPAEFKEALEPRIRELASELQAAAEQRIRPVLEAAEVSAQQGDPAAALQKLAALEPVKYALLAGRVAALKARLAKPPAQKAEPQSLDSEADKKRVQEWLARFDQELDRQDLAQARKVVQEAQRSALQGKTKAQVEAMGALLEAYVVLAQSACAALPGAEKKTLRTSMGQGVVQTVSAGSLKVEVSPTPKVSYSVHLKWYELTEAQKAELGLTWHWPTTPAGKTAEAVHMLRPRPEIIASAEDLARAENLLAEAGGFPLVEHYRERIRWERQKAAEAAAGLAWLKVAAAGQKPCDEPEQAEALLKVLQDFEAAHGQTQFAKKKAGELEELRSRTQLEPVNFALASAGANATGCQAPDLLIDGQSTQYTGNTGFAHTNWTHKPPQAMLVTLCQPVRLGHIRFLLWDKDARFYRYLLEGSPTAEGDNFVVLADHTAAQERTRSWQEISFPPQKLQRIRLTGTHNSANSGFHVVELEAYRSAPKRAAAIAPPANDPAAQDKQRVQQRFQAWVEHLLAQRYAEALAFIHPEEVRRLGPDSLLNAFKVGHGLAQVARLSAKDIRTREVKLAPDGQTLELVPEYFIGGVWKPQKPCSWKRHDGEWYRDWKP